MFSYPVGRDPVCGPCNAYELPDRSMAVRQRNTQYGYKRTSDVLRWRVKKRRILSPLLVLSAWENASGETWMQSPVMGLGRGRILRPKPPAGSPGSSPFVGCDHYAAKRRDRLSSVHHMSMWIRGAGNRIEVAFRFYPCWCEGRRANAALTPRWVS